MGLSYHHEEFRIYLQSEFERRCRNNPRYSLRSFAKNLGVESSALSKIIRGKRALTPKSLEHLANSLGIDPAARARLSSPEKTIGSKSSENEMSFRILEIDRFQAVSNWYHFAILELVCFKDFSLDPKWIAARLSIGITEAAIALERLQRLNLLTIDPETGRAKAGSFSTLAFKDSNVALKTLQKAILDQAKVAMDEIAVEQRENATLTVATTYEKIAIAKKKIQDFRRELCKFLQEDNEAEAVYQFSTHFFPITKKLSLTENKNQTKDGSAKKSRSHLQ